MLPVQKAYNDGYTILKTHKPGHVKEYFNKWTKKKAAYWATFIMHHYTIIAFRKRLKPNLQYLYFPILLPKNRFISEI